jgi:hypothetical protein
VLGSLLATLLDLGDERDVRVHPTRHCRPLYPGGLRTFTMCTASEQHVDSQILTLRKSGMVTIMAGSIPIGES